MRVGAAQEQPSLFNYQSVMAKTILVVEDDPGLQSQLKWCFDGFEVLTAADQKTAEKIIATNRPQVITLDLGIPPDPGGVTVGFALLQYALSQIPGVKVIVVTGQEDREHALKAVSMGAYDFFNKPVDAAVLSLVVDRAYHLHALELENRRLQEQVGQSPLEGVVTSSRSMLKVCELVEKVAPSNLAVMVLGESGTGKEIVARAIHRHSAYSEGGFIAINCAAIPENLLESELFGHEKGSFTGAHQQKRGKIELADKGTLFLDEIGDMPLDLQSKLLRFLQERSIERVGGTRQISIDTRVVCATHQPISEMIEEKRFREDLYYRLSDIVLELPPLRERDDDVLMLANVFANRAADQHGKVIKGFSAEAQGALLNHPFTGNVRELDQVVRRAVIMTANPIIQLDDLQLVSASGRHRQTAEDSSQERSLNLNDARAKLEKRLIRQAVAESNGNISKAAKLLDITRPTLYSLMERLDISADQAP